MTGDGCNRPEDSRLAGEAGEGLVVGLVLVNLWWTTLCLGGFRAETMAVTATLGVAALASWLALEAWRGCGLRLHWVALATLPFLTYAAANAAWVTPVPWLGWWDWLGWAQMAMVFWTVLHGVRGARTREILFWGLVALGVVAVAMAAYQHFADPRWLTMGRRQAVQFLGRSSGPFGIPNSLAALLTLLLPPLLALVLQRGAGAVQRVLCGYLAAVFAAGLLLTVSRGAWLALGAALVAWPLLAVPGRTRRWLWSVAVAVGLILLAGIIFPKVPKVRERVDRLLRDRVEVSRVIMWSAGWALFRESPLMGTGAGSYNVLFERHRPARFWDAPQWAHNDYLNTLSDYGAVGFLLSFGLAAVFFGRSSALRCDDGVVAGARSGAMARWQALRAGLVIGLLAFALQLAVDFSLKIPALAQAAAVAAALVISPADARTLALFRRGRWLAWMAPTAAAALVIVILVVKWLPVYRAEALRYEARESRNRAIRVPPGAAERDLPSRFARDRLTRAVEVDPSNAQAWSDLADALVQRAREEPAGSAELGRQAEVAATRALALSAAVPEFWLRRGVALDLQDRWRDAWADFLRALALAPHRADIWYYYACHLSLRDRESAKAALATCLALDPWNQPALALQRRLGSGHR
jgi:O-antigen ligase/tetratricopeptide (TPR) repeat protein